MHGLFLNRTYKRRPELPENCRVKFIIGNSRWSMVTVTDDELAQQGTLSQVKELLHVKNECAKAVLRDLENPPIHLP